MFLFRRNLATGSRFALADRLVHRLRVESLEDRLLLASTTCDMGSQSVSPSTVRPVSDPCFGDPPKVAFVDDDFVDDGFVDDDFVDNDFVDNDFVKDGFNDLPFSVQTIHWQGRLTRVVAGQWIVKLKSPVGPGQFSSWRAATSQDDPSAVTYRRSLLSDDTWVIEAEPEVDPGQIVAALGADNVDYIEPNFLLQAAETIPNDPDFDRLWGLRNSGQTSGKINADVSATFAWDEATGSRDVVVASLDTGIDYNHVDLAANVWRNPHEVPGNGIDDDKNGFIDDVHGIDTFFGDSDPFDAGGHGTHTSGTLGAVGNNGLGIAGVAWNLQIMPLKFLADSGVGRTDAAIAALNYMTMMKRDFGINVVASNNSWFGGDRSQALEDAIADSIDAGIVFVAAAGNDHLNNDITPTWPATYPLDGIIAVASTDHEDHLANSSHFGRTAVDLAAPGVRIYSTLPSNQYGYLSGTSMATPHVTGAVALLKSVYPGASPAQVKAAILAGTDPVPELADKLVSGGRLNIAGALAQMGFFVNVATPAAGEILFKRPLEFVIEMSHALDVSSLAATDLTVNGIPADRVDLLSDRRLRFSFLTSPVTMDGVQQIRLEAAALTRQSDGAPAALFTAEFRFDSLLLEVAATRPTSNAFVETPWTFLEIDFNEPLDATTVDLDDLEVSAGQVLEATARDADTVLYVLSPLIDEQHFSFELAAGAVTDLAGNPQAPFSGALELDYGTVDFPAPWTPLNPRGTLAAERRVSGSIGNAADKDVFRLDLKRGQQMSLVVEPVNSLWPRVELLNESGDVISVGQASASGQSAVIASFVAVSDGVYQIRVWGADGTSGSYDLHVLLNAGFESELAIGLTNNSFLSAEDLSPHFVAREYDVWQAVVLGRSEDVDNYVVHVDAGDTLSVALATALPVAMRVELFDAAGGLRVAGVSSGQFTQVVDEFRGPEGLYNLRVSGAASDYTLVVLRNGSLDHGGNHVSSRSQSIDANLAVAGFLSAPPLASAGAAAAPRQAPLRPVFSYPDLAAAELIDVPAGEWLIVFDENVSWDEALARLQARGIAVLRGIPLFHAALVEVGPFSPGAWSEPCTPNRGSDTSNRIMRSMDLVGSPTIHALLPSGRCKATSCPPSGVMSMSMSMPLRLGVSFRATHRWWLPSSTRGSIGNMSIWRTISGTIREKSPATASMTTEMAGLTTYSDMTSRIRIPTPVTITATALTWRALSVRWATTVSASRASIGMYKSCLLKHLTRTGRGRSPTCSRLLST